MKARKMHPVFWPLISLVGLGLILNACASAGSPGVSQGKALLSHVQRVTDPSVPQSDLSALAQGNEAFAFDLYQALRSEQGNLFFSPYSLSSALGMAYGGARNLTEAQMAQVLQFDLPQDRLHPAFNALDQRLSPPAGTQSKEQQPFQLDVANSLWGQQDHPFRQEYLDLLALNYGAGMRLVDFQNNAEAARQAINQWVGDNTQQKIKDLVPPGGVNSDSRLVLANAIYFKGDWMHPFGNANTYDRPFNLLDGRQVQAPSMSFDHAQTLPYLAGDGFQAVELPYVGGQVSMLVLVPDQGKLAEFEQGLNAARLNQILDQLQPVQLQVVLPKFEFTAAYQLGDTLAGMGMPEAFCGAMPDFSGMDGGVGQLCIGAIFHKAFVKVDEKGTEAAAASAVVMEAMAVMGDQPIVLNVDRPFLFAIRHIPTGSILFIGRVLNPNS